MRAAVKNVFSAFGTCFGMKCNVFAKRKLVMAQRCADGAFNLGIGHIRKLLRIKQLCAADMNFSAARMLRPFRKCERSARGMHHINGNAKFTDKLRRPLGDGIRHRNAGQPPLGKQNDAAARLLGTHDVQNGGKIRTKHFFGDAMHHSKHGAQLRVCHEMRRENKGRPMRQHGKPDQPMVLIG